MDYLLTDIERENQRAYDSLVIFIEAIQGKEYQSLSLDLLFQLIWVDSL
jgi:hypothetical protein